MLPLPSETAELPMIECHCGHQSKSCVELIEKRGVCLCGQFVVARCKSRVRTSKEAWVNALTSLLEGIDCDYFGVTGISRCAIGEDEYRCVVIILVESSVAHNKIIERLDDRYREMRGIEFARDSTRELLYYSTCYSEHDENLEEVSDFTFGNESVFQDWEWFYFHDESIS